MTKKHFEAAARIVREETIGLGKKVEVAKAFIILFSAFNPRFDRGRFLKACELEN